MQHVSPRMEYEAPAIVWRRFCIWAALALVGFLALVGIGGYSGAILLGWAAGIVLGAALILVRQSS